VEAFIHLVRRELVAQAAAEQVLLAALTQLRELQILAVVVADRHTPYPQREAMVALALSSSATLVHSAAQAAQLPHQADTPSIHLLLLGHTQHEPFCKSC
jgi:hypothetical protein